MFQASDAGGDIGFGDAEDVGDLALRSLVQVEQQQGAIQCGLAMNELLQQLQLLRVFVRIRVRVGDVVEVRNTGRPQDLGNGITEWNVSWKNWLDNSKTGPVTTDPIEQPSA